MIRFAVGLRNGIYAIIYWFVIRSFYAISFNAIVSIDVYDFSKSTAPYMSFIKNLSDMEFVSNFKF